MARVSNYYTNFYYGGWVYSQNTSISPNYTVMGLGSSWSYSDWNSANIIWTGYIPDDFRNYTYIENNFDAWGVFFGGGRAATLSEYSDLVIFGGDDDVIYVRDDAWDPWGGDDVVWGGSGNDTIFFTDNYYSNSSNSFSDYIFTTGVDSFGSYINIVKTGFSGSITAYGVESFYWGDTNESVSSQFFTTSPPTVLSAIPNLTVNEDDILHYNTSSHFTDIDTNDVLTYSATLADNSALPSWLSINPTTGVISGTPDNGDVGSLDIVVSAIDVAGHSVSDTYTLTVANINDTPLVSIGSSSVTVDAGESLIFQNSNIFSDIDIGDSLTYSLTSANGDPLLSWISLNTSTGELTGTPNNNNIGTFDVLITATDNQNASASHTLEFVITNIPNPPTIFSTVNHASISEGQYYEVNLSNYFIDTDPGDILTYSATLSNGLELPEWLSINAATGVISGTPGQSAAGPVGTSLDVNITATDLSNNSVSTVYVLTVNDNVTSATIDENVGGNIVGDAPSNINTSYAIGESEWAYGSVNSGFYAADTDVYLLGVLAPGEYTVDVDNITWANQMDNASISYFLVLDSNGNSVGSGSADNNETLIVSAESTYYVEIVGPSYNNTTAQYAVTYYQVSELQNTPPTVDSPIQNTSTNEDSAYSYDASVNFTDIDVGDALTYSATQTDNSALPNWLSINSTTGVISGTPANGDDGTLNIVVTATDVSGASVSDTYTLTVNDSNPGNVELSGIVRDNITVNSGTTLSLIGNVQIASGVTISVAAGGEIDLGGFSISSWGIINLEGDEDSFAVMQNGDYSSEASTSVLNINYGHLNNIEGDPFSDDGLLILNNSYVNNSSIEALDNNTITNSLFNHSSLSLDNQNASIGQSTFLQSQISALALFGTVNISETNFINNSTAIYLNPLYGNGFTHNINIVDSYIHSYNNESIEQHIYDADDNLSLNTNIEESSFTHIPFYNSSSTINSNPDSFIVGGMYVDWVNLTVEEAHNIVIHTPGTDVTGTSGIDDISINNTFSDHAIGSITDASGNTTVVMTDTSGNTTTITDVENFNFSDQSFDIASLQANDSTRPLFASPELVAGAWVNSYILPDVFYSGNAGLDALYDYQYYGDNDGNILVASNDNDFINGFGGDDAINTGAGNDIVDGGLGSNFLTGGTGNDTFFSDGREAVNGAITWSTVTDFTDGANSVNIWGYVDGTSTYQWYADAGATGWTGATLHADLDGNGTIDTSTTFTGMSITDMGTPQGLEVGGNGYLLIG